MCPLVCVYPTQGLPWANPSLVFFKARSFEALVADAGNGKLAKDFQTRLKGGVLASPEVVAELFGDGYDACGDRDRQLSMHEVITMVRFASANGKAAECDYRQLLKQIIDPTPASSDS